MSQVVNLSNLLTITRILLTPFIVVGIVYNTWSWVFFLLLMAGLTDVLDGHFARKFDQRTQLGASLDPIADKVLLVSSFVALCFVDSPSFSIPLWFVFLIFIREIVILGGSALLWFLGINFTISPSKAGKLTTFFQLSFILWIFSCYFFGWNPIRTYSVFLVLVALFSLISLIQYGVLGIKYLHRIRK